MTVAFDAFSASAIGAGNAVWTHTPVGTPKGVIVFVVNSSGSDQITGITYGASAMTEVSGSPLIMGGGTAGYNVHCYVLTSSVPTGAQTVTATSAGGTSIGYAITLTAGGDIEVIDTDASINTSLTAVNPSATLALAGRTCFCAMGFASGQDAAASVTPFTNWTARDETVRASIEIFACYTYDTIGSTDVTAGWTQTAEDAIAIAIAVSEVVSGAALVKLVNETMNPSEASNYTRLRIQHIAETENEAEALNEAEVLVRTQLETVQLGEAKNQIIGLIKNIAEEVRAGEAQNAAFGLVRTISEAENLSELAQSVIGFVKIVNESSQIAEAFNYTMGALLVKNIDEGIQLIETLNAVMGMIRAVGENVQLYEFDSYITTLIKVVSETIELSESFNEIMEQPEQVDHINVQMTERYASNSGTYVDVPGAAIPGSFFVPGKKYLIMVSALVDSSTGFSNLYVRAAHGDTAFDQSEYSQETSTVSGTGNECTYYWWYVHEAIAEGDFDPDDFEADDFETTSGIGEDIKLQIKNQLMIGNETTGIDQISMTAIRLTDQLDENTDYFYNEVTADTALTNADSSTNNAAVTHSISGDWLVLTLSRYTPGTTTIDYGSRLVRSGEASSTQPSFLQEGEDTTVPSLDKIVVTNMRVFTTGAVSNTFTEKSYHDGSGSSGTRHQSQVFALNLNAFRSHEFAYTEAELTPSDITDYVDTVQSLSITMAVEADLLVLGSVCHDANILNVTIKGRIRVDGIDLIDTMSIDAYAQENSYDPTDELPVQYQGIVDTLAAGTHAITLDCSTSDITSRFEDRFLVAFTMRRLSPSLALIRTVDESIELIEDTLRALGIIYTLNEEMRVLEPTGGFDPGGFDPEGFDTGTGVIKVLGITRTVSEVLNLAETVPYMRALSRVVNENETLVELANRVMALTKVVNESVELSEVVNRLDTLIKTINETIELTESENHLLTIIRVISEVVENSEALAKVIGMVRMVNESETVIEAQNNLLGLVRVVIENQEVAEALNQVQGLVRSINELMNIQEPESDFDPGDFDPDDFASGAVIAVLGLARTVNELTQIFENHPQAMGFTKVINESIELGEVVQKIQAIIKIVNESTELGEDIPRLIGLVRQVDERVDLPETINRLGALARVVNEGEQISEAVNRLGALVIAVTESETIAEAANQVRGLVRLINEDSTITEAFDRLSGLIRHANEVESINEELSRILGMAKTVNETESVEEIANKVMGLVRVVSELEDVSESVNAVKGIVKVILESETLAEALNKIMTTPAIVRILFGDRVRFSTLQGETIYFPNTSDVVKSTRTDDNVSMD